MEDLIDRKRIAAARAAHQAAIEAEGAAGTDADAAHNAWASAKIASDRALLDAPDRAQAAQDKCDAAERAARLASRVCAARTAARAESLTAMGGEIMQAHGAAVRGAVMARVAAVRKAAALLAELKETEAAYREADRALQSCHASGGVQLPNELQIGNGLMRADGKPIGVVEHENRLRGCQYDPETGQGNWMETVA